MSFVPSKAAKKQGIASATMSNSVRKAAGRFALGGCQLPPSAPKHLKKK